MKTRLSVLPRYKRRTVVQADKGMKAFNTCKQVHTDTEWRDYPMGHEVCLEQLETYTFGSSLFSKRR